MNRYTIFCTEKQTKKALNLGAPLEIGEGKNTVLCRLQNYHTYKRCVIPTAEQMIGWLEEQEDISVDILYVFGWTFNIWYFTQLHVHSGNVYDTRKGATIAAIDAAMDYLTNQKIK